MGPDSAIGITLAPINPWEQPSYTRWKDLAAALRLPCLFEVGGEHGLDFAENLRAADLILTTSVAEGFGLVFLETWLAGRPLVGRDLPEITADFRAAGIRLDGLGAHLLVPVDWLGESTFCDSFGAAYGQVLRDYGLPVPPQEQLAAKARRLVRNGLVDFAFLPGVMQESLITRLAAAQADALNCIGKTPGWNRRYSTPPRPVSCPRTPPSFALNIPSPNVVSNCGIFTGRSWPTHQTRPSWGRGMGNKSWRRFSVRTASNP